MARLQPINPPFQGISVIVNVNNRVGPKETNSPDDVKVVQRLLQMAGKGQVFSSEVGLPAVTGRFDAVTGFWIFRIQSVRKRSSPNQIVDGVASPAQAAGAYSPGSPWMIVILNSLAKEHDPAGYAAFVAGGGEP